MTTQTEIIEMARQAGINNSTNGLFFQCDKHDLSRFAKLVAEAEREACAILAQKTVCDTHIPTGVRIYGTAAAKAIRARGEA